MITDAIEFVKEIFENDFSGHDYFHTLRVYKTATKIAIKESANLEIVQLAALLHDVDDIKVSPKTHLNKDNAVNFLKSHNVNEDVVQEICKIISEVSFAGSGAVRPESIEGKCVQDADRLDALGAIGIARAVAYGENHNCMIYHPDIQPKTNMTKEEYYYSVSTSLNHFYEKLFLLKDLVSTESAKEMAEYRENYMKEFISEFLDEWDGLR